MNSFLPGPRLATPEAGESGSLTRPSILAGAAGQGSRDPGCLKACACREACRQPGSTAGLGPRVLPWALAQRSRWLRSHESTAVGVETGRGVQLALAQFS